MSRSSGGWQQGFGKEGLEIHGCRIDGITERLNDISQVHPELHAMVEALRCLTTRRVFIDVLKDTRQLPKLSIGRLPLTDGGHGIFLHNRLRPV